MAEYKDEITSGSCDIGALLNSLKWRSNVLKNLVLSRASKHVLDTYWRRMLNSTTVSLRTSSNTCKMNLNSELNIFSYKVPIIADRWRHNSISEIGCSSSGYNKFVFYSAWRNTSLKACTCLTTFYTTAMSCFATAGFIDFNSGGNSKW